MNDLSIKTIISKLIEVYDPHNIYPNIERMLMLGKMSGWVIRSKSRLPVFNRLVEIYPKEEKILVNDFPVRGYSTIYRAGKRVELYKGKTCIKVRDNPRKYFFQSWGAIKRLLWWDKLDAAYFCGYAIWNYFNFPYILYTPGTKIKNMGMVRVKDKSNRNQKKLLLLLKVTFPKTFHTHCPKQLFYIDPKTFMLDRIKYKVDVGWLNDIKIVHYCFDYKSFGGFLVSTKRRAYLRKDQFFYKKRLEVWKDTIPMWGEIVNIDMEFSEEK